MNTNGLNKLVLASLLQMAFLNLVIAPAVADPAARSEALAQAIEAHGGLSTWRSYARYDYHTVDFPLGANAPFDFTQTTDLRSRRHLTQGGGFTAGLNEHKAWAQPSVEALGLPPAFFESDNFYFIAMPFVFADPGVIARTWAARHSGDESTTSSPSPTPQASATRPRMITSFTSMPRPTACT